MYIGKNIRYLRGKNRQTLKHLAEKLGKTAGAIGDYERNRNTPPVEVLLQICEIYEVNIDDLINKDLEAEQYTSGQTAERTAPYNSTQDEKLLYTLLKEKFKQVASELKEKDLEAYKKLGLDKLEDW